MTKDSPGQGGGGGGPAEAGAPRAPPRKAPPQPPAGGGGGAPCCPPPPPPPPAPCHDEHRRELETLRAELEAERLRSQEARRRAALEARELREAAERERQLLADQLRSKWEQQRAREAHQLREAGLRQREAEIRQLLRWKEAELREALELVLRERDAAMRQARELQRQLAEELVGRGYAGGGGPRGGGGGGGGMSAEGRAKLQEVMSRLRWEADSEQAVRIRHFKAELELERSLFLKYILERFEGERAAPQAPRPPAPQPARPPAKTRPRSLESLLAASGAAADAGPASKARSLHSTLAPGPAPEEQKKPPAGPAPQPPAAAEKQAEEAPDDGPQPEPSADSPPEGRVGVWGSPAPAQQPDWLSSSSYNQLAKQNADLLTSLADLERRCTRLKDENALLRRSSFPEMQDRVTRLKRNHTELAGLAKRLEERAKSLQASGLRLGGAPGPLALSCADGDLAKSGQALEDLRSDADVLGAQDHQLDALQKECWELQAKLSAGKEGTCVLRLGDFECLLRESQREVLRLQRQIMLKNERESVQVLGVGAKGTSPSVITQDVLSTADVRLEDSLSAKGTPETSSAAANGGESNPPPLGTRNGEKNASKSESESKDDDCPLLKRQLADSLALCCQLQRQVEEKRAQCEDLERQRDEAMSQHAQVAKENARLQRKAAWAERTRRENAEMKAKLMQAVDERATATALAKGLESKVERLEQALRSMEQSAERWQRGQSEHEKALSALQRKEEEIRQLQEVQNEIKKGHAEAVQQLEAQVRELENQHHSQNEHFNLLSQELERLQTEKSAPSESGRAAWSAATATAPEQWGQEACKVLPCNADAHGEDSASTVSADAKGSDTRSNSSGSESGQNSSKSCLDPEDDTDGETETLEAEKVSLGNSSPVPLRVFLARYSYDPLRGPNENPETELPLTAGEYVYIYGEMDEDGFYEGELMDGRRGLVPSNLVEEVSGNSLITFVPPEPSDVSGLNFASQSSGENSDSPDENRPASLFSSLIEDGLYDSRAAVPHPQNLTLIKQLPRSIVIGWDPPREPDGWGRVQSYNVYVNTDLCLNVGRGSPTKTVIGSLDLALQTYRISVQSVMDGGDSDKMQCTFLVGDCFPVAPTLLKVRNLTATSAKITWLPSNSNYAHRVYRDETESGLSKPGVYWYAFRNLTPSTRYNVRVETLIPKEALVFPQGNLEQRSAALTFTTPLARSPEAPLDVQAQLAPSADFLVVNWLPVTIDATGSSNGVKVTGYAVYISGQKVAEIASPTAGSLSLDVSQLHWFEGPRKVSVRTLSLFGESEESVPALIPSSLLKAPGSPPSDASSQAPELTTRGSENGRIPKSPSPRFSHTRLANPHPNFTIHFSSNCHNSVAPGPGSVSKRPVSSSALTASHHARSEEEGNSILPASVGRPPFPESTLEGPTRAIPTAALKTLAGDTERERPAERGLMKKPKSQLHSSKKTGHDTAQLGNLAARNPPFQSCAENGASPLSSELVSSSVEFGPRKGSYGDAAIQSRTLQGKPDHFLNSKNLKQIQQLCRELSNLTMSAADTQEDQRSRNESCQAGDYHFDLSGREEDNNCQSKTNRPAQKGSWPPEKPASPVELGPEKRIAAISRADEAVTSSIPCSPSLPKSLVWGNGAPERLFVALFNYDPVTMSPNSDGAEEELPFREGQILKVTGEKDVDGFYLGECEGRRGYIPCNLVSEMRIESFEVKELLLKADCVQDES